MTPITVKHWYLNGTTAEMITPPTESNDNYVYNGHVLTNTGTQTISDKTYDVYECEETADTWYINRETSDFTFRAYKKSSTSNVIYVEESGLYDNGDYIYTYHSTGNYYEPIGQCIYTYTDIHHFRTPDGSIITTDSVKTTDYWAIYNGDYDYIYLEYHNGTVDPYTSTIYNLYDEGTVTPNPYVTIEIPLTDVTRLITQDGEDYYYNSSLLTQTDDTIIDGVTYNTYISAGGATVYKITELVDTDIYYLWLEEISVPSDTVTFFFNSALSDLLTVKKSEDTATYYFGVKLCESVSGSEDTLILGDSELGELNTITVYPKKVEGFIND